MRTVLSRLATVSAWVAVVAALSSCAGYAPPQDFNGMTSEQITAVMGPPDTRRAVEGGTRLEFPRGPAGRHTWFVYLDANGRAVRTEQVLTEANFIRINPGMSQDEVLLRLGRPGEVQRLARARGSVWSYRYENNQCLWFQIEMAQEKVVRSAGYGEPPECLRRGDVLMP